MHTRSTAYTPPPDRPPYLRVPLDGETVLVLRLPSLHKFGTLMASVDPERRHQIVALPELLADGHSALALAGQWPDALGVMAGILGLSWADPTLALDTPTPTTTGESLLAYGASVYEELHDAGWTGSQIASVALTLLGAIEQQSQFDEKAVARAAHFRLPRASTTESGSESNAGSSAATPDGDSTN